MRLALTLMLATITAADAAGPEWGADLSSWPRVAADHPHLDPIATWKNAGGSWVRLRVFHDPEDEHASTADTIVLATRAKQAGLKVLLALHLSDTWADPGNQRPPRAWNGLDVAGLEDSLRAHVGSVLDRFARASVTVDAVQVGNEIDAGILLPHGSFDGGAASTLLRAGIESVRAHSRARVVLHVTGQAEGRVATARLAAVEGVDVVALSWYAWWHGDRAALERALERIAQATDRPVWIVETAHPFTLEWNDARHNVVGEPRHVAQGSPATPEGQRAWFASLAVTARSRPQVTAIFAWEPLWLAHDDPGSPWENLAWFDFDGRALPVWTVLPRARLAEEHR